MNIRLANKISYDSIVDGIGLRVVIWMQGCIHNCYLCHNPQTHDLNGGFEENIDSIVEEATSYPLKSGITISGGDPFEQKEALLELVTKLKEHKENIWVYTGYTFESLNKPIDLQILKNIDVLVDGPFINDLKKDTLRFKGSSNQRIINVQETLKQNKIIELEF